MSSMGTDKSEELVLTSLSRAHLCELLAPLVGLKERSSELFLLGLFSLLDRQFFSTGQPMIGKNLIGFFQSFDEKLRQVILY